VYGNLQKRYDAEIEADLVTLTVIPAIESINYGRDVGYGIIEHAPPAEIEAISATKIREALNDTNI